MQSSVLLNFIPSKVQLLKWSQSPEQNGLIQQSELLDELLDNWDKELNDVEDELVLYDDEE